MSTNDSSNQDNKQEEGVQPDQFRDTELETVSAERDDYKTRYLRALADYQNLERRVKDERLEIAKITQSNLLFRILPFLDNLEQAEIFIKDPGLAMIKNSFMQLLQEMNLKEIEVIGKEFDPHLAEAIDVVEGDAENIVVEVARKGYMFNNKVLRPAQVKVSKVVSHSH